MGTRCAMILVLLTTILFVAPASLAQSQPIPTQPAQLNAKKAVVVALEGQIDDYNRDALIRRFKDARALGAEIIILRIDTYGGLVTAGLDISRFIKQQNHVQTIAFVNDKAISAGAMIAMACDEIVMEPRAVIGDCAPIMIRTDGSLQPLPDAERGKMESPILADFRDSAQRNGHDPLLAEAMVSVDRVVYYLQSPDGVRRFVNQPDYDKLTADDWKPVDGVPNPVDGAKELLTIHTDTATRIGIASAAFDSPEALAASRGYQIIATLAPGAGEKLIELLNSPVVRGLLIALFIFSIRIALSTPGHGVPEAFSLISLGLLVGVPLLTGYGTWWEILIIFAGLALLAFEIFVFPGHLVSALSGILMVIGGLIMTFVPKEPGGLPGYLPSLNGTYAAMQQGLFVVASGLTCALLLWLWLQRYLPKIPYFRNLVLTTTVGSTETHVDLPAAIEWPTLGATGTCTTDLYPGGKASFYDHALGDQRITQVISAGGFISAGTRIVVREVAGNRIVVQKMS